MLRRRYLAAVGGVGAVGGYVAGRVHASIRERWASSETSLNGYELGRADGLSIETVPDRAFELHDDGETVVLDHDPGERYTVPLDSWAPGVAASVGSRAVHDRLRSTVPTDELAIGHGAVDFDRLSDAQADGPEFDVTAGVIVTWPISLQDRSDGTEQAVSFETLVDTSPRSVDVVLDIDGHEYAAVVPVVCTARATERY